MQRPCGRRECRVLKELNEAVQGSTIKMVVKGQVGRWGRPQVVLVPLKR